MSDTAEQKNPGTASGTGPSWHRDDRPTSSSCASRTCASTSAPRTARHAPSQSANLTVRRGQTVAIVGESGSGKTTLAMAVLGLLASNGSVAEGHIWFKDEDLGKVSPQRMAQLRGTELGLVPQDPMTNLDPIMQIGQQVDEGLIDNGLRSRRDARARTVELLDEVGLPDARRRSASTRTSSRAACASGRSSPWACRAALRCWWRTSRRRRST